MRFAYDRFGMGRYRYDPSDYKNPRYGYKNSPTRGSVGLESSRNQMPAANGSIGSYNIAPFKEDVHQARSGAIGQYRAI